MAGARTRLNHPTLTGVGADAGGFPIPALRAWLTTATAANHVVQDPAP